MSVLSVGLVAGPSSPARLERRTEDSTSWGASFRFSRGAGDGERGERGEGLGVSSPVGNVVRYRTNVVSIGIGANRARGRSFALAIPVCDSTARRCYTIGGVWSVGGGIGRGNGKSVWSFGPLSVNFGRLWSRSVPMARAGCKPDSWNVAAREEIGLPARTPAEHTKWFCILTDVARDQDCGGSGSGHRSPELRRVSQHSPGNLTNECQRSPAVRKSKWGMASGVIDCVPAPCGRRFLDAADCRVTHFPRVAALVF
jgi:hypothetical protein